MLGLKGASPSELRLATLQGKRVLTCKASDCEENFGPFRLFSERAFCFGAGRGCFVRSLPDNDFVKTKVADSLAC